jgi:DNA-binding MarR family transcriptional regulator
VSGRWRGRAGSGRSAAGWVRRREVKGRVNMVRILGHYFLGRKFRESESGIGSGRVERDDVDAVIEQWDRERPDLDSSPIGVVGRLSRLARELELRMEPTYRERGLEGGWYDVLATLRRSGPPYRLRPHELGATTMLTSSGTTKRLDRLEAAGLIARTPDPTDRRGTQITLTEAGHAALDATIQAHLDNERELIAALSAAEQEQLAGLLRKLRLGLPPVR